MVKKSKIAFAVGLALFSQLINAQDSQECNDEVKNCHNGHKKQQYSVLDEVSVTANRSETDIAKYAGQISVLDENGLKSSDNVIKSIAHLPGIQTGNDFGRSIGSQYKIRGFGYKGGDRVIIEQDGVKRAPSLFSNHISTFRVDNDLLKRVEVVKGASSILHGSGAIGGIISMQTKDAEDFINDGKQVGFTVGGRIESNNMKSGRLAFAIAPNNLPIDFLIYGKNADLDNITLADDGFYDKDEKAQIDEAFNDEKIKTGYIQGGWDIAPDMRLSLSAYKYAENIMTTWQTLYHFDPGKLPVHGDLRQKDYVANFTYQPSDNPLIDISVKLYSSDASYHRVRKGKFRGKPTHIDYVNDDKRWGIAVKNKANWKAGSIGHQIVTGIDYDHREENAIFNYNGELTDFGSFPNAYKDLGIYMQDTLTIGNLDLTIGGRYDTFRRRVDLPDRDGYSDNHFSPKMSVSYELLDGFNLLAGYAETFRGPTPNETGASGSLNPHYYFLPNNDLKAETAKDIEVGFSYDKDGVFNADDSLYLKATYFDGKIDDMINLKGLEELGKTPDNDEYEHQIYAQYQNVSNARRRGIELETKYTIGNANFTLGYDHLKLTNENTGKRLDDFADKVTFSTGYFIEKLDLELGIQATHQFRAKRDKYSFTRWGENYDYINKSFTVVDLKGQWIPDNTGSDLFDEGFTLQFGVNNLFNKKFINPAKIDNTKAVGKGRNIYLELEKTF